MPRNPKPQTDDAMVPADLAPMPDLARELGIGYRRLQQWYYKGRIPHPFKRGDGTVLLSRAEVIAYRDKLEAIAPITPRAEEGQGEGESQPTE